MHRIVQYESSLSSSERDLPHTPLSNDRQNSNDIPPTSLQNSAEINDKDL